MTYRPNDILIPPSEPQQVVSPIVVPSDPLAETVASTSTSILTTPVTPAPEENPLEGTFKWISLGEYHLLALDTLPTPQEYGKLTTNSSYTTHVGETILFGPPHNQTLLVYGGIDQAPITNNSLPQVLSFSSDFTFLNKPHFASAYLYRYAWKGFSFGRFE